MEVEIYTFEDKDGNTQGWTTENPVDAREHAQKHGLRWIANKFELCDSELVEDCTEEQS